MENNQQIDIICSEIIKLVHEAKRYQISTRNQHYMLGKQYLLIMVTDIILFDMDQKPANFEIIIKKDFAHIISNLPGIVSKQNMLIGFAKIYKENNLEKIKKVKAEVKSFLELYLPMHKDQINDSNNFPQIHNDQTNKTSNSNNSKFAQSVETQLTSQSNSLDESVIHLQSESGQNGGLNDDLMTEIDFGQFHNKNHSYDKPKNGQNGQNNQAYKKQVNEYIEGKISSTILNHLQQFKKGIFIVKNTPDKKVNSFVHRTSMEFVDFLNDGQVKQYVGFGQALNGKQAKEKANRMLVKIFFLENTYVFKEFTYFIKGKTGL